MCFEKCREMLLLHVENTKSPTPSPRSGASIPMKILIFWPKYCCCFFNVRILKLENQTWQLCTSQYNLDSLPNPHKC